MGPETEASAAVLPIAGNGQPLAAASRILLTKSESSSTIDPGEILKRYNAPLVFHWRAEQCGRWLTCKLD